MDKKRLKIAINGFGRTGKAVANECEKRGYDFRVAESEAELFGMTDVDGVIDFSVPSAIKGVCLFASERRLPLVIGTTGLTEKESEYIREAKKVVPVTVKANFGRGVAMLKDLAVLAARALPEADVLVLETHKKGKKDKPSGTAKEIVEALNKVREESGKVGGVEVVSFRAGNAVGEHEVTFIDGNELLSVRHEAFSPSAFAAGALDELEKLLGVKKG